MKRLLPIFLALSASAAMAIDKPTSESMTFTDETLSSISPNGEWVAGGMGDEFTVIIRNLTTGKKWTYSEFNGETGMGTQYTVGLGKCVSNNGIVVGEVDDMPAYWEDGAWHDLSTKVGQTVYRGAMQVGSITPDGSIIVGAIGNSGGLTQGFEEDVMYTAPCLWQRNADGSGYGDPVMLPHPERDITNAIPQYFTALAISDDGKTIGALMTCNYGFPHVPYSYTQDADGEWQYTMMGEDLINPEHRVFPKYSGEYNGPNRPNWEEYMTQAEMEQYFAAGDAYVRYLESQGYNEYEIELLLWGYAANFMTEPRKGEFEALWDEYYTAYVEWWEAYSQYETILSQVITEGMGFIFNNMCISPDGKYIYATGTVYELVRPGNPENAFDQHCMPVAFEVGTDNYTVFSQKNDIRVASVTNDYSVLGKPNLGDGYLDTLAYIFPQGDTECVDLLSYFEEKGNIEVVDWIEENMIHYAQIGETTFDDVYSMGIPMATPDMSVIVFQTTSFYWEPMEDYLWVSYVLYTGEDVRSPESAVDTLETPNEGKPEYYNLQGVRVANPQHGIYVKIQDGKASKVVL